MYRGDFPAPKDRLNMFKKYFVRTKCPKCGSEFISVFELKRVSRPPEYWADKFGMGHEL